ncbi:MAG TPA: arginine--tRNA ligase [Acidobacteriota bacterium]|nr:arginine--tRNA ligase [Acidobacteriota bacterium]
MRPYVPSIRNPQSEIRNEFNPQSAIRNRFNPQSEIRNPQYDITPFPMLRLIERLQASLRAHVRSQYGIELDQVIAENPPRLEFGELAFPLAFELAKKLKRAPRQIAQEIAGTIEPTEGVAKIEAAGAGYLNAFLDRWWFLRQAGTFQSVAPRESGKIIVEHTNINPNKAAHIGHLRNAVVGDSFVRLLRFLGHPVEVQNYIDNTGVQVADVIVGFIHLRKFDLEAIKNIPGKIDYYCWDLYAEVSQWFQADEERLALRQQALRDIEDGHEPTASIAEYISTEIVKAHLKTMERINARYDLLPRESEILHLKFWDKAFQLLKERNAIKLEDQGPHKGCWVMKFGPEADASLPEAKIIVRSNGTITYVGKDIAYQMWKFGLLGRDFKYFPFYEYPDGHQVWMTATSSADQAPPFGKASRVYNVIDSRQSYLQKVVVEGLRVLGFEAQAENSIHFSYEIVALSPRCCEELGIRLSEEDAARPYVEVSGRRGLGVKVDDLLDSLVAKATEEVDRRKNFEDPKEADRNARQIAVAALRYFLAKFARNSLIAFDFQEALSFEGETGPYIQYSTVRANNIFRKLEQENPAWEANVSDFLKKTPSKHLGEGVRTLLNDDTVWELVLFNAKLEQVVRQAIDALEVSAIAKHAFNAAQKFNLFYHKHHILSEKDEQAQALLLAVTQLTRDCLTQMLELLGIEVPAKM